jgi:hypothetical protein
LRHAHYLRVLVQQSSEESKMIRRSLWLAFLVSFVALLPAMYAGPVERVRDERTIAKLRQTTGVNQRVAIDGIPLGESGLRSLDLKPMRVWASDAKIVVYGANGVDRVESAPNTRYFSGRISGLPDSRVMISLTEDDVISGLIVDGDRRFRVATGRRVGERADRERADRNAPLLVSELTQLDDLTDNRADWSCGAETNSPLARRLVTPRAVETGRFTPQTDAGNVPGAHYTLRIAFDTDDELFAAFGSVPAVNNYIGELVAATNIMYERDLNTTLLVGQINVRAGGPGSDPWTALPAGGTGAALAQLGTVWHNNFPAVERASAVMVSGKLFSGGIAWINVLGTADFFCDPEDGWTAPYANNWGGAYAFLGSAGSVTTTVPDPTLVVDGVEFGVGSGNFWMLLQFAHELGHNANGPHTHCVGLSGAEQAQYGVTRGFVDECYNRDSGCYGGTGGGTCNLLGGNSADPFCSAPAERGTIMSYCHNVFSGGGVRQSRYLMWKADEPSEKMLPFFEIGLETASPNPTITVQAEPVACSAGRTASVAACTNCTYAWELIGGTITSSTTTSAITYTPTEETVTLTVTVTNARGVGITASRAVDTACSAVVAPAPPTNIVATATGTTTVSITWNASVDADEYDVWRSAGGGSFALVGNAGGTLSFTDTTAVANTSYRYVVRAATAGQFSAFSLSDVATTVVFTDPTLTLGVTKCKLVHLTQLLTAVNALRTLAGLSPIAFTAPAPTTAVTVRRQHLLDLRAGLDAARGVLALSAISYTDPTITAASTKIKAVHFTQLRDGVK